MQVMSDAPDRARARRQSISARCDVTLCLKGRILPRRVGTAIATATVAIGTGLLLYVRNELLSG
jgi:hypothetical protein